MKKIVIVGGGAGGLQLATRLGKRLGKKNLAEITLIDQNRVHLWKPLLHEVVAGSLDTGAEALSYRAHSSENGYYYRMGSMIGLDKQNKNLTLAPLFDHHNKQVLAQRTVEYDYLVIAVGARSNDFGLAGVREHCTTLDSANEAEDFHLTFLNQFLKYSEESNEEIEHGEYNVPPQLPPVHIAIVGAGATGVELAAELYNAVDRLEQFGVKQIHHTSLQVTLIEAFERILPALPIALASKAQKALEQQGVRILTQTMVKDIQSQKLITADGEIKADLIVWAAGVKAPQFLSQLGLPTNRIHQLEIDSCLNVKGEDAIFAIGDCACLLNGDDKTARPIPPTAQAASQMAALCTYNLQAKLNGQPLKPFAYNDHGTLISLSRFQTLGNLLDELFKKHWMVEGKFAQWAYASLYRQHQMTLHGGWKLFWILLGSFIEKRVKPKLKLY
ncbi:NAD(P)/FAD-dependent oxidoreductase [Thiomicrorhabdus aquaedulcis]|uniref:NAD(P)/FAD-dependent oxidoreductase n=1 Tax=Thiomicrorhabdus aquaedulcis TaxID=2211106 RepID=UPI000FDA39DB|nr:NAD(P)/FAD-dependent oxidoreductase [Thiomicrorhabdus aquaedulcis]